MNPSINSNKSPNPHFHSPSQLRIADILFAGDDDDHDRYPLMGQSTDFAGRTSCSSLSRVVARWLSRLRRSRVKRVAGETVKSEEGENRSVHTTCSTNGLNEGNAVDSSVSETGGVNSSFNLGIGCCLLYLLAASNNELHKMVEMRKQMEGLLVRTKEELLEKNEANQCPILPGSSTVTVYEQSYRCETPGREEFSEEGMDRLEAELQAELELLQRHLDSDKLLHPREEEKIKAGDENSTSSKSQALSFGEVVDPPCRELDSDCGVPPEELERRLHELLEERQQEQIRELQNALESLKYKLQEKELEVNWWRDTAKIIAQHATDISCIASRRD